MNNVPGMGLYKALTLLGILLVIGCSGPISNDGGFDTPTFTVVYDGNGNDGGTTPVDSAAYTSGASATVLDQGSLLKTGCTFTGWNTQKNGSGTSHPTGTSLTVAGDLTLYAQWAEVLTSAKSLMAFGFWGLTPVVDGIIDQAASAVTVAVPFGTNVSSLVASFVSTGATVNVGAAVQQSGVTSNDFSQPVIYTVTAIDGSTQDYRVTVTMMSPLSGTVTTFAGSLSPGYADGVGSAARFREPFGITSDGVNLYIADSDNHVIRKIVIATREVTTLAGALSFGYVDGVGGAARFGFPTALATDGVNLYVVDEGNGRIRKIVIATGQVTTLAGFNDGLGSMASFDELIGIATDGANLYLTDRVSIRKMVIATGLVTVLSQPVHSDFYGIVTDGVNLYITEEFDSDFLGVRKLDLATGSLTSLAGGPHQSPADGVGSTAGFVRAFGVATDGVNLYVGDASRIRKLVIATGAVTTLAGSGSGHADGVGSAASFNVVRGVATDGVNLYVVDTENNLIRKITK